MDERLTFGYGASLTRRAPAAASPGPTGASPAVSWDAAAVADADDKRDWAFVGLLIFTGLLFLRPQDTFPILRPLPLADIAAIFALGAMAFGRLGRGLPVTRMPPELWGVVGLAAVILATAPFSVWPGGALGTFTKMYSKVVLIFVLMINTLTSPKRTERFIWLLVLASGYLSARAVIDYGRGVNLIEYGRVQGSVGGMFKNPNDLALNMVAIMPFAAMLALRPLTPVKRGLAAASGLAMLGAVIVSQSRGGTVGLVAMLLVLGLWLIRRRPGLIFGVCLAGVLASPLVPESYWARVVTIVNPDLDTGGSREARKALNREAWAAFLTHPLTGVGAGNFPVYNPEGRQEAWREVHNVVLQVAAELGVVGLSVFGFLVGSALWAPLHARRILRRLEKGVRGRAPPAPPLPAGDAEWVAVSTAAVSAAVVGWFFCAIFAPVAYHWTFYYLLALAMAPRDYLAARVAAARAINRVRRPGVMAAAGVHA